MRVVIFGVDGLTFRIVRPLIERGDLPNFARLQREGVESEFISTVPALTPPAWTSLVTGLKPAKHGVFDFWDFDLATPGSKPIPVTGRKGGKAIWNILSEYGKRVIVMNVPVTYPPEAVNGIMVSGLQTPGLSSAFTYPATFKEELLRVIPDYRIDLKLDETSPRYIDMVLDMTEKRIQLQEHLLSEHPWDFAFLAYVGPDRLQHVAWESIATLSHAATTYYRMLDDALGRVLARLTEDDVLFVASDHGFVGATNWIFINEYLRQQHLLTYGSPMATSRAKLVGYTREAARKLGILNLMRQGRKRARRALGDEIVPKSQPEYYPSVRGVDWRHTRACVPSASAFGAGYADIFMHADATEADMEELRQALAAERHPETGEPLADAIYATDAFGIGPFRPPEEHLILAARTGTTFHLGIGRPDLWGPLDKIMGVHEKEGVFYAWGAGIRRGAQVDPLQIYDLVPTVLQSLGIAVDEPFDGHVAQQVFAAPATADDDRDEESVVARKLKRLQAGVHPVS